MAIATDPTIGNVYTGKVVKVMQFGAFVEFAPGKDGMVHISKLSDKRVEKVEDIVNVGDSVKVEVIKIDDKGRIDLRLVEKIIEKQKSRIYGCGFLLNFCFDLLFYLFFCS